VDLRVGPARLGEGGGRIYEGVRKVAVFLDRDYPMEGDIAAPALVKSLAPLGR
jgi:hypothetical protein